LATLGNQGSSSAYIERQTDNHDGRELLLRLTAKGKRLHGKLIVAVVEKEHDMLSCLSAQEKRQFVRALDKLEQSLQLVQVKNQTHS